VHPFLKKLQTEHRFSSRTLAHTLAVAQSIAALSQRTTLDEQDIQEALTYHHKHHQKQCSRHYSHAF
jgi:predicted ATPase with chaperone activity